MPIIVDEPWDEEQETGQVIRPGFRTTAAYSIRRGEHSRYAWVVLSQLKQTTLAEGSADSLEEARELVADTFPAPHEAANRPRTPSTGNPTRPRRHHPTTTRRRPAPSTAASAARVADGCPISPGFPEAGPSVVRAASAHSFTAPALAFMIRFWNTKNTIARGIVISTAAASLSGYACPG